MTHSIGNQDKNRLSLHGDQNKSLKKRTLQNLVHPSALTTDVKKII